MQSFLQMRPVQKQVLPSHNLQDHAYKWQNPFGLKEDNFWPRNFQNILRHPSLSHIEQECQEFASRNDWNSAKFEQRPRILVKISFREFCDSKLSGLYLFDNTAIL